jgi:hypothetical protein
MDWKDCRLYVNLSDIRDYDFFTVTSLLDESRSAGSETPDHGFVELAGSIQLFTSLLLLPWPQVESNWTASDPAGSPNPQAGPRGLIALK